MQSIRFLVCFFLQVAFLSSISALQQLQPLSESTFVGNYPNLPDVDFQYILNFFANHTAQSSPAPEAASSLRGSLHELSHHSHHGDIDLDAISLSGYLSTNAYYDGACKKLMLKIFYQLDKCVDYIPQAGTYVMLKLYPQPLYKRFVVVAQQYSDAQCATKPIKVVDTQYLPNNACVNQLINTRFNSLSFPAKGDYAVVSLYQSSQQCTVNDPSKGLLLGLYVNSGTCYSVGLAYDLFFAGCDSQGRFQISLRNPGKTPCGGTVLSNNIIVPDCSSKAYAILSAFGFGGFGNVYCKKA